MPTYSTEASQRPTLESKKNQILQSGLPKEEEEEESSPKFDQDWIKIGEEYYQSPVSITLNENLKQVVKEFSAADPVSYEFHQNCDAMHKRKRGFYEEEAEEEDALNMSYAFIKNRSTNLQEKHVKLHVINEHFKISDSGAKKDKVYTLPYGFKTKRRYLYEL